MKNLESITGKLTIIERLNNSTNGNPKYKVLIDNTLLVTISDSMLGYGISNYENKNVTATIGYYYNKLSIHSIKEV